MSLGIKQENKWIEEDEKHLEFLVKKYLVAKNYWKLNWGEKNRYKLQEDYRKLEDELWHRLPDPYEIDGLIIKKGFYNAGEKSRNYLQVFTKESYGRAKNYLKKATHTPPL